MKDKQLIITIVSVVLGQYKDHKTEQFNAEYKAKEFINGFLDGELNAMKSRTADKDICVHVVSGSLRDLWDKKEGEIVFAISDFEYRIGFVNLPAEYGVSDDEIITALEAFVNSGRTPYDYDVVARKISANMHRYCQNELWKFVKAIIRAFAEDRCDERNAVAKEQATAVQDFISSNLK